MHGSFALAEDDSSRRPWLGRRRGWDCLPSMTAVSKSDDLVANVEFKEAKLWS